MHVGTHTTPQNDISLAAQKTALAGAVPFRQTTIQHGPLAEPSTTSTHAVGTRKATAQYLSSSTLSSAARYGRQTHKQNAASHSSHSNDESTARCDEVDYIREPPQYMVTIRSLSIAQYVQAWDSSWEQMEDYGSNSSRSDSDNLGNNSDCSTSSTSRSMSRRSSNSNSPSSNSDRDRHQNYYGGANATPTDTSWQSSVTG